MKDEDAEAISTATEILLSLAYMHLSDEGRATMANEAAQALAYLTDGQPSADAVRLGIYTCLETLDAKRARRDEPNAPTRQELAATRMRANLEGGRPVSGLSHRQS